MEKELITSIQTRLQAASYRTNFCPGDDLGFNPSLDDQRPEHAGALLGALGDARIDGYYRIILYEVQVIGLRRIRANVCAGPAHEQLLNWRDLNDRKRAVLPLSLGARGIFSIEAAPEIRVANATDYGK
jgi:hypothetical protein